MSSIFLFAVLLFLSAVYSGSETGVYSLSRIRLDSDAHAKRPMARLLTRLLRGDTGILITLLIGNNLMLELATHLAQRKVGGWDFLPPWGREVFVTAALTPVVFVVGELFPKDLFRRRPHALLYPITPLIALSRLVYLPVALPLQGLSLVLERVLGIRDQSLARALGRDEVQDVLRQGAREGAIAARAEPIAHNVLVLRETPVAAVMIPWHTIETVDLDAPPAAVWERVGNSEFTRLPALRSGAEGGPRVVGYLHQLDVLAAAPGARSDALLRPLPVVAPDLPVDRALNKMRISGQRTALVGSPEAPLGLVSLMDLIEAISGDPLS